MTTTRTTARPARRGEKTVPDAGPRDGRQGNKPAFIRWFRDIDRTAIPDVGGKGANLGEMARAGLPVPPGFVVAVSAYQFFLEKSIDARRVAGIVSGLDVDASESLEKASRDLRDLIEEADLPSELRDAIQGAYRRLCDDEGVTDLAVAVRSSAPSEDTEQFSFAGMFESYLDVRGAKDLVQRVRDCWASGFGERILFYRAKQGMAPEQPLAVVVQRMVASEKAGVLFTVDPATKDPKRIVVEAAWGLGEVVVGGEVTPDRYVIDKDSLAAVDQTIARKEFMLAIDERTGKQTRIDLARDDRSSARVLDETELRAVAALGKKAENHYGEPQDVEFTIAGGDIFIVQTRPVTTLKTANANRGAPSPESSQPEERAASNGVIVRGLGASPGIATGNVRVLNKASDGNALQQGEILVAPMTAPDWVPVMRRAAAIVTDAGGMTSHAAIVSRELGIPCVVGAHDATRKLQNGVAVTVDGREGTVRAGDKGQPSESGTAAAVSTPSSPSRPIPSSTAIITGTRLYVNLAEPELAEETARGDVDGVGLLRAEFMLLSALDNTHPRRFIENKGADEFVSRMKDKLLVFARAFHPRPVIYRATDLRSNEFRGLTGGEQYEPQEQNPMIGYRGCYRYTREPDLFTLELRVLHDVRMDFDNLHLMIPFVRTKRELAACLKLIDGSPLGGDARLERWVMAEVPSIVYWLPQYAALGIHGVSIGSNDLTQLLLGVDRDSEAVAPLYDERDPAVLNALETIIASCRRVGLRCSICGQAPSVHPDYADLLVRWGIDSISVNPDALERTRRNIAAAEQRVLLESRRTS